MKDERYWPVLGTWLKDTAEAPPDPRQTASRVAARLPHTPQVRRRWWLPPLRRTPGSPHRSNQKAVIGRTQTMFSPVKAITAGALIFALGGLFLIAQPFDQQGSIPGAEQGAELAPPVAVTITVSSFTEVDDEVCTGDMPAVCTWGGSGQWSASDPRLSGTTTERATEYFWPVGGYVEAYTIEVVNDEGAWVGTRRAFVADGGVQGTDMYTLIGRGAHEGLAAFLAADPGAAEDEEGWVGVIVEGGLAPFPEPLE